MTILLLPVKGVVLVNEEGVALAAGGSSVVVVDVGVLRSSQWHAD